MGEYIATAAYVGFALPAPVLFFLFFLSGGTGQFDTGHSPMFAAAVGGADPVGVAIVVRQFRRLHE